MAIALRFQLGILSCQLTQTLLALSTSLPCIALPKSLTESRVLLSQRFETRVALQKRQPHFACWAIPLFCDNDVCPITEFCIVRLVDFLTENEHHQICVLLDRT